MYNWEKFKSKSNSESEHNHHNHRVDDYDPKTPTFSSFFLNKPNKSHHPKMSQILKSDRLKSVPASTNVHLDEYFFKTTTTTKNRGSITRMAPIEDEKMSSLRRACLVEKWMEKKVSDKAISRGEMKSSSRSSSTLLEVFDLHDAMFFSSTTTTTTSSSTSSSETEYSVFTHPKHKPNVTCFAPPRPKPIKTYSIESKFIEQPGEETDEAYSKNRSRAAKVYSNLKNLRQPISPGVRLTSLINSLFAKDAKNSKKKRSNFAIQRSSNNTEETTATTITTSYSYPHSACSSASSYSRSCMIKSKKCQDDGIQRKVKFCPVSVLIDDDSQPCGYKSLREEKRDRLMNTKLGRSLSKRYEALRKLNGLEQEGGALYQQKNLEQVALDLISGYWDARLNKSHDLSSKNKANEDYGFNCNQQIEDGDDDDGFSCSSSDLFELDHLSLIGNELPVYETTQFGT